MADGKGIKLSFSSTAQTKKKGDAIEKKFMRRGNLFDKLNKDEDEEMSQGDADILKRMNVDAMIRKTYAQDNNSSKSLVDKALEEDPNVFDYDGMYDKIKREENKRKSQIDRVNEDGFLKPKYLDSIISATARRKLELERIGIKNSQRQRLLEKGMYGETEEFVTPAYKMKIAEIERLEAQEKLLEEARHKNKDTDLIAFYRDILDDRGVKNVNLDVGSQEKVVNEKIDGKEFLPNDLEYTVSSPEQEILIRKNEVEVNDSNEVVDKTQLFKGGLNVTHEAKLRDLRTNRIKEAAAKLKNIKYLNSPSYNTSNPLNNSTLNLRHDILKQREEAILKERIKKESEFSKIRQKLASNVVESHISSAKERYTARKKLKLPESDEDDY